MIDFKEIRKSVAIEHNTLLEPDDPILMSVTVHEQVLQHYVNMLLEKQMEHMQALEAAQQRGLAESKIIACRVITEGGSYVSEQANMAVTAALDEGMAQIKRELLEVQMEVIRERGKAVNAAGLAIASSVVTLGLAVYMAVGGV